MEKIIKIALILVIILSVNTFAFAGTSADNNLIFQNNIEDYENRKSHGPEHEVDPVTYEFLLKGTECVEKGLATRNPEDFEEAISWFKKANDTASFTKIGLIYQDIYQDLDNAIIWYKKAIEVDPSNSGAMNNLGNCYYGLSDYDNAISWYKKAIEADPSFSFPMNSLGNCYYDFSDYDNAISWYKKAIEVDPDYAHPMNGLGNCYYDLSDYDNAISWYKKAIEADPSDSNTMYNLGICYKDLSDYDNAISWYKKAIEADPSDSDTMYNLGLCYYNLSDYDNAISWYKKAADNGIVKAMSDLGYIYYLLSDYNNSIVWYKNAADQGNEAALKNFGIIISYYQQPLPSQEGKLLDEYNSGNYESGLELAYIKTYQEKYDDAIKIFTFISSKGYPCATYWAGYCFEKKNETSKAKYWYDKAAREGFRKQ